MLLYELKFIYFSVLTNKILKKKTNCLNSHCNIYLHYFNHPQIIKHSNIILKMKINLPYASSVTHVVTSSSPVQYTSCRRDAQSLTDLDSPERRTPQLSESTPTLTPAPSPMGLKSRCGMRLESVLSKHNHNTTNAQHTHDHHTTIRKSIEKISF